MKQTTWHLSMEAIADSEQDILEGTELLVRNVDNDTPEEENEGDREVTRYKNIICSEKQILTTENVCNL